MSDQGFSVLLITWAAFSVAVISPGPNLIAVASRALGGGRAAAIAVAIGIASGTLVWATVTLAGLGVLFDAWPQLPGLLGTLGGLYLFWLGVRGLSAIRSGTDTAIESSGRAGLWSNLLHGFLINVTNPKACLFWISLSSIIGNEARSIAYFAVFTLVCVVIALTVYCTYAVLFSTHRAQFLYGRFRRTGEAIFGVVFTALGLGMILRSN